VIRYEARRRNLIFQGFFGPGSLGLFGVCTRLRDIWQCPTSNFMSTAGPTFDPIYGPVYIAQGAPTLNTVGASASPALLITSSAIASAAVAAGLGALSTCSAFGCWMK